MLSSDPSETFRKFWYKTSVKNGVNGAMTLHDVKRTWRHNILHAQNEIETKMNKEITDWQLRTQ